MARANLGSVKGSHDPHPLQNGIGGGGTSGIPVVVPFSLVWERLD